MDVKNERRNMIKCCRWLKKSPAETGKLMHKAHNAEKWLGDSTVYHWHKACSKAEKPCWTTIKHLPKGDSEYSHSCRSRNCHITVRQLAQALDISTLFVHMNHMILWEKLKIQRITACGVHHFLTRDQRDHCIEICHGWLKRIEDELDVMRRMITGDKSWIHHCDPATL